MTEYLCKATIDGKNFEFETMGAVTVPQAYQQFEEYLHEQEHRVLAIASHTEFERFEM
ncbi:hypothetical protein ALT721_800028 [Alteromonas alvinellae]